MKDPIMRDIIVFHIKCIKMFIHLYVHYMKLDDAVLKENVKEVRKSLEEAIPRFENNQEIHRFLAGGREDYKGVRFFSFYFEEINRCLKEGGNTAPILAWINESVTEAIDDLMLRNI